MSSRLHPRSNQKSPHGNLYSTLKKVFGRARHSCWQLIVAGIVVLCSSPMFVSTARTLADEPPRAQFGIAKVLVLKNGRTVEGTINRNAGGYVVDKPTGSMVIPEKQVQFAAASRAEAYQKVRESIDLKTAGGHVRLAEWCLNNAYHDEAASELREALALEPKRDDARRMLTRLEEIVNPENPRNRLVEKSPPRTVDGFNTPEVRSVGNLSREAAMQYVSKIQPILMNRCGTAGCHGPAETNGLRLERVISGSNTHRLYTDRNLATVSRYIDTSSAEKSPLLAVPQGAHGKNGQLLFAGPAGTEQLKLLQSWVNSVAAEKQKDERAATSRVSMLKDRGPLTPGPASTKEKKSGENVESPSGDVLEKALRDERPDAFNPKDFNTRHHGAGRKRNALSGN